MKDKNVEIVRMLKGGLSEGLEDKGTSDQEDHIQERDSDFKFLLEDVIKTDSGLEPNPAPDNGQNVDAEDVLEDTYIKQGPSKRLS